LAFDLKSWLDENAIPRLQPELRLHSVARRGSTEGDVPVAILVTALSVNSSDWPTAVARLLKKDGFAFDYLREAQFVQGENGEAVTLFGCDGRPFISPSRMLSTRLYRRTSDGIELVLDVGYQSAYPDVGPTLIRRLFSLLGEQSPVEAVWKFAAVFGGA